MAAGFVFVTASVTIESDADRAAAAPLRLPRGELAPERCACSEVRVGDAVGVWMAAKSIADERECWPSSSSSFSARL